MPKKPLSHKAAAAKPIKIKMPKTRLNRGHKDILLDYMVKQFDSRIDDTERDAACNALIQATNVILRKKYLEADMPTLRKYGLARVDTCLRFTRTETERFFYVRFEGVEEIATQLADVVGGCRTGDVFECDSAFEVLVARWEQLVQERSDKVAAKRTEYRGFIEACRYLEDVESVVPITEELRKALGAGSRSLAVINPDIISRIKSDFALGVTA